MRSTRALAVLSGLLCVLVAGAHAQSASAIADISGAWRFQTEAINSDGCTLAGDISFRRADAGGYMCDFVAEERCRSPHFHKVRQSCSATVAGHNILIRSRVEEMLDAGPPEQRATLMDMRIYAPDNFAVRPADDGDLVGMFTSNSSAPVRFRRKQGDRVS